jgi:SAM-dependent methyltransferase
MRLNSYLHYFFYIAWHWNPILASFVIYYEITGESKYHINTLREDELKSLKEKGIDISHASIYMPVNYYVIERLMREIVKYGGNKTFLDIGCGKGRAMIVAATFGFEQITGIDFSKEFCEEAESTIQLYVARFKVINIDAYYFEMPDDITTFFFFNPFDEFIMKEVVSNIMKSLHRNSRTIRVLYANPQHKSIFLENGFCEIYHFKKWSYFEGIILQLN